MVLVIDGEEVDPGANMKAMFDNVAKYLDDTHLLFHAFRIVMGYKCG